MNTEAQRIAIAEACGLNPRGYAPYCSVCRETVGRDEVFEDVHQKCGGRVRCDSPNYLEDLNAIHEAVMALPSNTRDLVNLKLCEITAGNFDYSEVHDMDASLNATAAQRAEAFLKTIDKWQE